VGEMSEKGIVDRGSAEEALDKAMSKDKYSGKLDDKKLSRGDKLNVINDLLTDIHLNLVGSGKVSTTEAKNFRHFVKKEFKKVIDSKERGGKDDKAGQMLNDVVWRGYNAYVQFKLDKIEEIKKKKAARIQKILDRREARRR
jgi:hypothetical protein